MLIPGQMTRLVRSAGLKSQKYGLAASARRVCGRQRHLAALGRRDTAAIVGALGWARRGLGQPAVQEIRQAARGVGRQRELVDMCQRGVSADIFRVQ